MKVLVIQKDWYLSILNSSIFISFKEYTYIMKVGQKFLESSNYFRSNVLEAMSTLLIKWGVFCFLLLLLLFAFTNLQASYAAKHITFLSQKNRTMQSSVGDFLCFMFAHSAPEIQLWWKLIENSLEFLMYPWVLEIPRRNFFLLVPLAKHRNIANYSS